MTTRILDLDLLEAPWRPEVLRVEEDEAFVTLWLGGRPVGQAWLAAEELRRDDLAQLLFGIAGEPARRRWLEHLLQLDGAGPRAGPTIGVAVCTRDRLDDLERCLDAVGRLLDPPHEILVVDSASRHGVDVRSLARTSGARYLREDRPGLDRARNRALRATASEVVAFIDDDAAPDPRWLTALRNGFADPMTLAVTGLTLPAELETPAQRWHERHSTFGRGFEPRVFDARSLPPAASGQVGAGVNMALRRRAAELVGPFDESLDAGTPTRSGGDNEMFGRILAAGYRIRYLPDAVVRHRHRRSRRALRSTFFGYGVGVYAAWTRALADREWSVLRVAPSWLLKRQLPNLFLRLLGSRRAPPVDLQLAELAGCLTGPWAYLRSRRRSTGEPP